MNIALGNLPISDCPQSDTDGDGQVSADEILVAATNAQNGCTLFQPAARAAF